MSKTIVKNKLYEGDVLFFKGNSTGLINLAKAIKSGENYQKYEIAKKRIRILAPYETMDTVMALSNIISKEDADKIAKVGLVYSKKVMSDEESFNFLKAFFDKTVFFYDAAEPQDEVYFVSLSGSLGNAFKEDCNKVIEMMKNLASKTGTTIIFTGSPVFGVTNATPEEIEAFNNSETFNDYATDIMK